MEPNEVNQSQIQPSSPTEEFTINQGLPPDELNTSPQNSSGNKKPLIIVIVVIAVIIISAIIFIRPVRVVKTVSDDAKKRDDQRVEDVGRIAGYTAAYLQNNKKCPTTPDDLKTSYITSIPVDPQSKKPYTVTDSGEVCTISAELEDKNSIWLKLDSTPGDAVYTNTVR